MGRSPRPASLSPVGLHRRPHSPLSQFIPLEIGQMPLHLLCEPDELLVVENADKVRGGDTAFVEVASGIRERVDRQLWNCVIEVSQKRVWGLSPQSEFLQLA